MYLKSDALLGMRTSPRGRQVYINPLVRGEKSTSLRFNIPSLKFHHTISMASDNSRRSQPRAIDRDWSHVHPSHRPVPQTPDSPSSIYSPRSPRSGDDWSSASIWERRGRHNNVLSPLSPPMRLPIQPPGPPPTLTVEEERRAVYSAPPSAASFQDSPASSFHLSEDDMNPWPITSIRPPIRAQSQRRATFEDDTDIGLFAQAVAGFERERSPVDEASTPRPSSPQPPPTAPPQPVEPQPEYQSSLYDEDEPEPLRFPGSAQTYLSPPFQQNRNSRSMPLPSPEDERLPPEYSPHTYSRHLSTRYAQGSLMDHSLFVQATTGLMPDIHTTDDDDLPDYAQSQLEMAQRRRREGLMRAAELERKWAEASGRHR